MLADPDCALVYSDDDELDHSGQRTAPRFKPDWNPDLLSSSHYLGQVSLYRRDRLLEIGGYRPGFAGAEDYDLCLRYTNNLPGSAIRHVPQITCHCRPKGETVAGTTAHDSGKRALEDFFAGRGVFVEDGPAPQHYRIRHPLPDPLPLVSIIIPTRDQGNILAACIDSIVRKTTYSNWEILIVDNQTTEPSALAYLETVQLDPRIRVLRYDKPFNYAAINNTAAMQARGEVLALLNNDVEVITSDWLEEMVGHALRPGIGAVGAKLLYANNTVQHAGVILGLGGIAGHGHKYLSADAPGYCHRAVVAQNLSAVTGACLVVRTSIFTEVGGLDEYFAVAFNDIDFCLRLLERGYRNVFTPYAKLYHHESLSRGQDNSPAKHAVFVRESSLMQQRWKDILAQDRAYNPNLSTDFEGFSLKIR
jgi:GT2 family glycosyltransferase